LLVLSIDMPSVLPSLEALSGTFAPRSPASDANKTPGEAPPKQRPLFPAWSAVEDVKHTAVKEYEKASAKAQAKAGHIELHSAKFYAACTFGGLMACVSIANAHTVCLFSRASLFPVTCYLVQA
jgi:solute carrier family 25 phosphate transporter 3